MKFRRFYFESLDSTNVRLAKLASEGAEEGTLVIAAEQTAGRGRRGRPWLSPPGKNIYASLLLHPDVSLLFVPQLALVAGLALKDTIQIYLPNHEPSVKWPNDILLNGRKLSGILCETTKTGQVILGIGVNVNMVASDFDTDLQKKATSLLIEAGHDFDTSEVLDAFLNVFKRLYAEWLQAGSLEPFVDRLHDESLLTGRRVELNVGNRKVSGIVRGVAKTGELLLESDDGGIKAFSSGEARLLPVG